MPLGRKPLTAYGTSYSSTSTYSTMSHDADPPLKRSPGDEKDDSDFQNTKTGPASNLRSASPRAARQRSTSPRKTTEKLYPNLDDQKPYDASPYVYSNSLYPHIDRDAYDASDAIRRPIKQSTTALVYFESAGRNNDDEELEDRLRHSADVNMASAKPVPATRRRRGQGDGPIVTVRERNVPVISPPISPILWLSFILAFAATLFAICYYFYFIKDAPLTPEQVFERQFQEFNRNYIEEIHPDAMDQLHGALRNHIDLASGTSQYPTCVLLAADRTTGNTLNCLASDIARMIPARDPVKNSAKNVYVVDLMDNKINHRNPDQESLRSRVHYGINEGLNEGAKVIVFRNIETLVPDDIPLMELFYSYCDGDNPTFPKTLWILTLGTTDLEVLKAAKFADEEHVHRAVAVKVEKYLESMLESASDRDDAPGQRNKVTRNPILTRIANYIVPILNAGRTLPSCSVV